MYHNIWCRSCSRAEVLGPHTPTRSPPLTPTLGCSLADKMTRTIPMMNHSFRILARRPMFQYRGSTGSNPAGPRHTSRTEVLQLLSLLSSGGVLSQNTSRTSRATSGHMSPSCRKDGSRGATVFKLP